MSFCQVRKQTAVGDSWEERDTGRRGRPETKWHGGIERGGRSQIRDAADADEARMADKELMEENGRK